MGTHSHSHSSHTVLTLSYSSPFLLPLLLDSPSELMTPRLAAQFPFPAPAADNSFVFKLKFTRNGKDETRRYGFSGDLNQEQVYAGLYDRTSQVFSLPRSSFHLVYTPSPSSSPITLDTYSSYIHHVCDSLGSDSTSLKRDEKKRIVLVFQVVVIPPPTTTTKKEEVVLPSIQMPKPLGCQMPVNPTINTSWERDIEVGFSTDTSSPPLAVTDSTPLPRFSSSLQGPRPPPPFSTLFGPPPPSTTQDVPNPYTWNWSQPPPPPPQTNLNHVEKKREMTMRSFRKSGELKDKLDEIKSRNEERKKELMRGLGGSGYRPSYIPTPFQQEVMNAIPAPVPVPILAAETEKPTETEKDKEKEKETDTETVGWNGVKTLLKTFVRDFNRHLLDNFGDDVGPFELRLEEEEKRALEGVEEKKVVHHTCWCDRCLKTIVGDRHKCAQCANYDLCEGCLGKKDEWHERGHEFLLIRKPGDAPVSGAVKDEVEVKVEVKEEQEEQEHPATCDICDKTIKGIRHKCINCPDYDVCTTCLPHLPTLHPLHNFLPIASPLTSFKSQPGDRHIHHNVVCDGCHASPIIGIRYRCTHDECQNVHLGGFDLCANCEADPVPRHDRKHVMMKIREPVESGFGKRVEEVVRQARRFNPVTAGREREGSPSAQLGNGIATLLASLGVGPHTQAATRTTSTATDSPQMMDQSVGTALPTTTVNYVAGKGADEGQDVLVVDVDVSALRREEKARLPETIYMPLAMKKGAFNEPYDVEQLVKEAEKEEEKEEEEEDVGEEEVGEEEVYEEEEVEEVDVPVTVPSPQLELDGEFLSDITLKDGSLVPAGGLFVKIWQVRNSGHADWPLGTQLVNIGGFSKSPVRSQVPPVIDVPLAKAGEIVELSCELKAPEDDGRHMDHWRLSAPDGELFGDRLWADITVESDEEALRNSGSSLSSSIVAPSIMTPGGNFQSAPSTETSTAKTPSEFESVRAEETSEDEEESDEEDDEEDDSESEFVVLSGSEDLDSDSDEEWSATA